MHRAVRFSTTDAMHEAHPDAYVKVPGENKSNARNSSTGTSYREYREAEGRSMEWWEAERGTDVPADSPVWIPTAAFGAGWTLGREVLEVTTGSKPKYPDGKVALTHFMLLGRCT